MYLVDTNVISEARRGSREARSWLRSVDPASVFLSVVTFGEIAKGIALKARSDPRAAVHLTAWLGAIRQDYRNRILDITDQIALEWGRLAAVRPRPMADGLIAATAIIHGQIMVTRNTADFADLPVQLISPWTV